MLSIRYVLIILVWSSQWQQSRSAALFGTSTNRNDNDPTDEEVSKVSKQHSQIVQLGPNGEGAVFDPSKNSIVHNFFQGTTSSSNSQTASNTTSIQLLNEIKTLANTPTLLMFLKSIRRQLHRHPELMYQESITSQTIQTLLTELKIPFTTGWGKNTHQELIRGPGGYGIVADIGTMASPCVILRADMDALPILEKTPGVESFTSREKGRMHACGHDGHTTMLLGAAALLKKMEESIQGTVRVLFQPAEEGGAGGKRMVEEGVVLMEPKAQMAFGIHVWPMLPSGTIASRPGPLLAAATQFKILISGTSGHAAMPHQTRDPIVAASSVVMNLQTIVSRTLSPLQSGVVSVTQLVAGDGSFNVIPAAASLKGTIRALSMDTLEVLKERVDTVVNATVQALGCNMTIEYSPDPYPPTVNDEVLWEGFSKGVGGLVSEEGSVRIVEPTMGAEDFAFFGEVVPSTFFLLGQGGADTATATDTATTADGEKEGHKPKTNYGLHNERFALDEDVLPLGVELHVNLALRALKKLGDDDTSANRDTTATA